MKFNYLRILLFILNLITKRFCAPKTTIIYSTPITNWGRWGPIEQCENGTIAVGFNTKVQEPQGSGDDTACNAIKLICSNKKAVYSLQGNHGSWGNDVYCPPNQYLTGFRLKVEPCQDFGDDTATNGIKMYCNNSFSLVNVNEGEWGSYGELFECPYKSYICGLKTQVEFEQNDGDETALNNVAFVCCYLDPSDFREESTTKDFGSEDE